MLLSSRASGFDYNFLMWATDAGNGVVRAPWLDVKLPVVDPDDIAASAVAVLVADNPAGGAYSITGPDALSVADQTAIAASALGRNLRAEQPGWPICGTVVGPRDNGVDRGRFRPRPGG